MGRTDWPTDPHPKKGEGNRKAPAQIERTEQRITGDLWIIVVRVWEESSGPVCPYHWALDLSQSPSTRTKLTCYLYGPSKDLLHPLRDTGGIGDDVCAQLTR